MVDPLEPESLPDNNKPEDGADKADEGYSARLDESATAPAVPDYSAYWKANILFVLSLVAVWFLVSNVFSIFLVNVLNKIPLGGFKLGFWFAQQGSIYVFMVLVLVYALGMRKLDRRFHVEEAKGDALEVAEE